MNERPGLRVLTDDPRLREITAALALEFDMEARDDAEDAPCVVDPAVGIPRLIEALSQPSIRNPPCAVLRRPAFPREVFLSLRLSDARLVVDPRFDASDLRRFIADAVALDATPHDRRGFPRGQSSGVELVNPPDWALADLSPYGARVRVPAGTEVPPIVRLTLRVSRLGLDDEVECQLAGQAVAGDHLELRLRFVRVRPEAQQEMFRIAKAQLTASSISETFQRCELAELTGFRRIDSPPQILRTIGELAEDGAHLNFARMHRGRVAVGKALRVSRSARTFEVAIEHPAVVGEVGSWICYAVSNRYESYTLDGYVLAVDGGRAVLTHPARMVLTDQRARERLELGLDSNLAVAIGGHRFRVHDLSPRGFSFYAEPDEESALAGDRFDAVFRLAEDLERRERVFLRHRRRQGAGYIIGATLMSEAVSPDSEEQPLAEEEFDGSDVVPTTAPHEYRGRLVRFASQRGLEAVGIWNEIDRPGPRTLVVVPPFWGKTKEVTSILAQFLCAMFEANDRHVAVLRFDYVNSVGESENEPPFRTPGSETLGMTATGCVADMNAAIAYGLEVLGGAAESVVLVGISFAGPLALHVAAQNPRVTRLVELMGASDMQDLIRTISGGIDLIANWRAGIRGQTVNLLGVLNDPDRWVPDGLANSLLLLQDAQAEAQRLTIPVLWIRGRYDAYVNEARIRSILGCATQVSRKLVTVPSGHVPMKSVEALVSYLPVARFLLEAVGVPRPVVCVPSEDQATLVMMEEWSRAPKSQFPPPRDYWREYMLGNTDHALGFDVMTMSREYGDMMRAICRLADPPQGAVVADLGAGLGHSVRFLLEGPRGPSLRLRLYDFVPQLLEEARRRNAAAADRIETVEWDAEGSSIPAELSEARVVVMSLFVGCLSDPAAFMARLVPRLAPGTRVVASTFKPDADFSLLYTKLLEDAVTGVVPPPPGYTQEQFIQAIRDYMNSAAFLLRLFEEGTFHLFSEDELVRLFTQAGLEVAGVERTWGTPHRGFVILAEKPRD